MKSLFALSPAKRLAWVLCVTILLLSIIALGLITKSSPSYARPGDDDGTPTPSVTGTSRLSPTASPTPSSTPRSTPSATLSPTPASTVTKTSGATPARTTNLTPGATATASRNGSTATPASSSQGTGAATPTLGAISNGGLLNPPGSQTQTAGNSGTTPLSTSHNSSLSFVPLVIGISVLGLSGTAIVLMFILVRHQRQLSKPRKKAACRGIASWEIVRHNTPRAKKGFLNQGAMGSSQVTFIDQPPMIALQMMSMQQPASPGSSSPSPLREGIKNEAFPQEDSHS